MITASNSEDIHPFLADDPPPKPSWIPDWDAPAQPKKPHDFQAWAAFEVLVAYKEGHRRVMVKLPTGGGKTVIAADIIRSALKKGKRILFVVNAISLVEQTVTKFWREGIRNIGVIQADHPMTDIRQPVQVCSVQTLQRRGIPDADLVIIDEAHHWFQLYGVWMAKPEWKDKLFIGLSATPYTVGLAKHYSKMVTPCSLQHLIDRGFLSPFRVYAPGKEKPDLSGCREQGDDYHTGDISLAMNKPKLVADAVDTWLKHAAGRPTFCYGVDRVHARCLAEAFLQAGVPSAYMDAYTPIEERRVIQEDFASGKVKVVCNVGVLTTGIDWDVRCISLCRPTKSEILFQQIIGRGLRTADGKDFCLVLDHSTTHFDLGLVTDVDERNKELHGGKPHKATVREKELRAAAACLQCGLVKTVAKCPVCGFLAQRKNTVHHRDGELVALDGKAARHSHEEKLQFYKGLLGYAEKQGYQLGWVAHKYRNKFGVWPRHRDATPCEPNAMVMGWIRHEQIAFAKSKVAT